MSFKLSDFNEKTQAKIRAQLNDLRAVETSLTKPTPAQTLDGSDDQREGCKGCVVSLVSHVRRLLDDDNAVAALKPLRDAIAASLGIDDGDKRFSWQYQQLKTKGSEGVIVQIEVI